ncbi:MAG TPA: ABC transporter ATP-binding protein [Albitalea sp.]|uniref:ABC transporter ATP-binding protein n=1 Tax=Piscinibacter sp. TaxID=1903157 RepID=UPI002ED64DCE
MTTSASLLSITQVSKSYGSTVALHPTDIRIERGEFVTLLGPSGCGKSTLLRIVCGVTPASAGSIVLDGQRIETLPPERRDIAMVFQSYALFPHMSVRKNLGFGLRMKRVEAAEQERRIAHAVEICNLGALLERSPRQLSGGQQQRVALARALVMQPALLLFDEPLSNLDAKLRESLRDELVRLHRATGSTSLYVTHDQAEAMAMSDRVMVMNSGRIVETGTPVQLYRRPRHIFTASFLGQTNLLRVAIAEGVATLPWGECCRVDGLASGTRNAQVSLRPEDIALTPDAQGPGWITGRSFAGASANYTLQVGDVALRASHAGATALLPVGERVALTTLAIPLHALEGPSP